MFRKYEKSSTSKAAFIDEKFASMQRIIDEHKKIINEKRLEIDIKNRKAIEEYQLLLFNKVKKLRQRWVLIDRIIDAEDYIKLLQNQQRFEEELNELAAEFDELMDPVPIEYDIEGLDKCLTTLDQSLGTTRVVEKPLYENEELEKLLASKRTDDMLNLNNYSFNDHDAVILARYLRKDKVLLRLSSLLLLYLFILLIIRRVLLEKKTRISERDRMRENQHSLWQEINLLR